MRATYSMEETCKPRMGHFKTKCNLAANSYAQAMEPCQVVEKSVNQLISGVVLRLTYLEYLATRVAYGCLKSKKWKWK